MRGLNIIPRPNSKYWIWYDTSVLWSSYQIMHDDMSSCNAFTWTGVFCKFFWNFQSYDRAGHSHIILLGMPGSLWRLHQCKRAPNRSDKRRFFSFAMKTTILKWITEWSALLNFFFKPLDSSLKLLNEGVHLNSFMNCINENKRVDKDQKTSVLRHY